MSVRTIAYQWLRWSALALAVAAAPGCGGDSAGDPSKRNGTSCGDVDPLGSGLAAERLLVEQGRRDAGFYALFGSGSEAAFEAADELRGELIQAMAGDEGIELPSAEEPPDGCPDRVPGTESEAFSRTSLTVLGWNTGWLKAAIQQAPIKGEGRTGPRTENDSYASADGTPITVTITTDAVTSGHESTVEVTVNASATLVAGDVTAVETATITASVNVCPDADGLALGNFVATFDGGATDGSSYKGVVEDDFYFVVDDSAHLSLTNHVYSSEYHATGPSPADVAAHGAATGSGSGGSIVGSNTSLDRADGAKASQELVLNNLFFYAAAPAINVGSDAEAKWRQNTCVEVHSDPASPAQGAIEVEAGETTSVTAAPFHKFEMEEFDAPVVATLSGKASVDPANKAVPSPATFEYVAGDECKDKGTVEFKSTSKRGIGKGSVSFEAKADPDMECPDGQVLNTDTCQCECEEKKSCPSGQTWDDETCECVCAMKSCPDGQTWDTASCKCLCKLECPAGKTLNPDECECEAACDFDGDVLPSDCKWAGTISVSSNESGEFSPGPSETISWEFEYQGSFQVEDDEPFGYLTLSGPVNGSFKQVSTTLGATEEACDTIITIDESLSKDLDHAGMVELSNDGGMARLWVGQADLLEGTRTENVCGNEFTTPSDLDSALPAGGLYCLTDFVGGSSFTGSCDGIDYLVELTGSPGRTFPDDSSAHFAVSWNLRAVRR